eukprot:2730285-Amphidinium_carterae.1
MCYLWAAWLPVTLLKSSAVLSAWRHASCESRLSDCRVASCLGGDSMNKAQGLTICDSQGSCIHPDSNHKEPNEKHAQFQSVLGISAPPTLRWRERLLAIYSMILFQSGRLNTHY